MYLSIVGLRWLYTSCTRQAVGVNCKAHATLWPPGPLVEITTPIIDSQPRSNNLTVPPQASIVTWTTAEPVPQHDGNHCVRIKLAAGLFASLGQKTKQAAPPRLILIVLSDLLGQHRGASDMKSESLLHICPPLGGAHRERCYGCMCLTASGTRGSPCPVCTRKRYLCWS